jgi:hypothetical protein
MGTNRFTAPLWGTLPTRRPIANRLFLTNIDRIIRTALTDSDQTILLQLAI